MNKHYRNILLIVISVIIGTLYYLNMSLSIPKESNCSFSANIWTDIFAFIAGGIIMYYGMHKHDEPVLTITGAVIITEHIWQLVHNKI